MVYIGRIRSVVLWKVWNSVILKATDVALKKVICGR